MAAVIMYSREVPVMRLISRRSIRSFRAVLLMTKPRIMLDTRTAPTRGKRLMMG